MITHTELELNKQSINMQFFNLLQFTMLFHLMVSVCRGYRLAANSSIDNEMGTPADIHMNRSMSSPASPESVLNTNWTENISTKESNQTKEVPDSTPSYSSLNTTSDGVQALFGSVSGNALQTKVPQVPSNHTTSTNNVLSNEDGSNSCPLLSFPTTSGFRNERETISYGLTTNPCITSQPHTLNQNQVLSIIQATEENLYYLMNDTKRVLSEIVRIYRLRVNSTRMNALRKIKFGCFTPMLEGDMEIHTSPEVQVQVLYKSFIKSYAFLDMTNKAVSEIKPTPEIYNEVEALKIRIKRTICRIDLLLRNQGTIMNDFPLYVKWKETVNFLPELVLGDNLYMYVNQIQDFLETVNFVGRKYLRSLVSYV